jgi:hypothetical protein
MTTPGLAPGADGRQRRIRARPVLLAHRQRRDNDVVPILAVL